MTLTPGQASVRDFCESRPVFTLAQVGSALPLAAITIRRCLKSLGCFCSFNHTARYYTLAYRPRFSPQGLWFYRSIGFSRHRTLTNTLLALVRDAPSGATPNELSALLRGPVGNVLASLARQQQLARRRLGHSVVYLACDPQRQDQQWLVRVNNRGATTLTQALPTNLPPTTLLPLLTELIRSPEASVDQLARALRRQGLPVHPPDVRAVFAFYQLEKKEARWRSPRCLKTSAVPPRTTCGDSAHPRRTPFTPSTSQPSNARTGRRWRR